LKSDKLRKKKYFHEKLVSIETKITFAAPYEGIEMKVERMSFEIE
jgi:hypothetical protein